MVAADGTVLIGSYDSRLYALNFNGTEVVCAWQFTGSGPFFSSPAIGPDGVLYVGTSSGTFYAIANVPGLAQGPWPMFRRNVTRTAYDWNAVGGGVQAGESVFCLMTGPGNLLNVGGTFATAGGVTVNGVAKWSGYGWSAFGSGLSDGCAAAMTVSGNNVYAGGLFDRAGGALGPNLGKWVGVGWATFFGPNGPVYALAAAPNADLYVGGTFTTFWGTPVNNVARFRNGGQALGSGVNGTVHALAIDSQGRVYVGGGFSTAGGVSCANVACWTDPTWSALSSGTDSPVETLAIGANGLDVYAGGAFVHAFNGATPVLANGIAKWSGGVWSAMGTGVQALNLETGGQWVLVPGRVNALAVAGSTVYAAGDFDVAGVVGAGSVAVWNGTAWLPLGSGINGIAYTLGLTSDYLYVGGEFSSAGGTVASGIAQWKR
jgi:trimeric autotransporter adhesin